MLTIANIKGGVAKTTSALNIGLILSEQHQQQVLLVDLDGQGSLSRSLPPEAPAGARRSDPPPADTRSIVEFLRGQAPLTPIIRPTRFSNVWLAPPSRDLYRLQLAGANRAQQELVLAEALRAVTVKDAAGQTITPDTRLMAESRTQAEWLWRQDPYLRKLEHAALRERVYLFWRDDAAQVGQAEQRARDIIAAGAGIVAVCGGGWEHQGR